MFSKYDLGNTFIQAVNFCHYSTGSVIKFLPGEEERFQLDRLGDIGVDVDGRLPLAPAVRVLVCPKLETLWAPVRKIVIVVNLCARNGLRQCQGDQEALAKHIRLPSATDAWRLSNSVSWRIEIITRNDGNSTR